MFYKNNSIQAIKAQYEEDNQSLNTQTIKTGSFVQLSVGGGWCSKPYFVFKKSNEMDVDVGQRRMNTIMSACLTAFSAECSTVLTSSSSVSRAALSSVEMSEITNVMWSDCPLSWTAHLTFLTQLHLDGFNASKVFINFVFCLPERVWAMLLVSGRHVCSAQCPRFSTSRLLQARDARDQQVGSQPAGMLISFPSTLEPARLRRDIGVLGAGFTWYLWR